MFIWGGVKENKVLKFAKLKEQNTPVVEQVSIGTPGKGRGFRLNAYLTGIRKL